ncbi:MAG: MaoC family dehydratase N-terminal domain-containing protein [Firmicutes bacterium]|nr:MaoC family dehydratase N-terminal domain-containing protein [Bacillota bacterium]
MEGSPDAVDASLVGRESAPRRVRVDPEAVRRFAAALGDPRGEEPGWVPPTFPIVFALLQDPVPGLSLDLRRVLHGEQSFTYARPLRRGEELEVRTRVAGVRQRQGSQGVLRFVDLETIGREPGGDEVFRALSTLVLRPLPAAGGEAR